jgi:hypothetical protein
MRKEASSMKKLCTAFVIALALSIAAAADAAEGGFVPSSVRVTSVIYSKGSCEINVPTVREVTLDDSKTALELYAALNDGIRTNGTYVTEYGRENQLLFTFEADGGQSVTASFRNSGALDKLAGFERFARAARLALWRNGYARFVRDEIFILNARTEEEAEISAYALLDLEGTWQWQASEGDGFFETYIYTFKDDGTMDIEEHLPGEKLYEASAFYGAEGGRLIIFMESEKRSADVPFTVFNGQLQLTFEGNTLVFEPKY